MQHNDGEYSSAMQCLSAQTCLRATEAHPAQSWLLRRQTRLLRPPGSGRGCSRPRCCAQLVAALHCWVGHPPSQLGCREICSQVRTLLCSQTRRTSMLSIHVALHCTCYCPAQDTRGARNAANVQQLPQSLDGSPQPLLLTPVHSRPGHFSSAAMPSLPSRSLSLQMPPASASASARAPPIPRILTRPGTQSAGELDM